MNDDPESEGPAKALNCTVAFILGILGIVAMIPHCCAS